MQKEIKASKRIGKPGNNLRKKLRDKSEKEIKERDLKKLKKSEKENERKKLKKSN